ncbi:MAG: sterol desaturase family protein [Parvularculaceae bacterium]|nr:sterol desaturase family protein [Parvularculaceae bacterium]
MSLWLKISLIVGSACFMEAFAWWAHKYIMHGWGWNWHADHHEPHDKTFEKNDLFVVVFGSFTAALIMIGIEWFEPLYYVGLGITLYGIMYSFVHDGLVHQRYPFHWFPKRGYWKRLVQAHKLHHATTCKEGAVSFGFVLAPDPQKLRVRLRELKERRRAAGSL